jgi:hypothetical protein
METTNKQTDLDEDQTIVMAVFKTALASLEQMTGDNRIISRVALLGQCAHEWSEQHAAGPRAVH